MTQLARRLEQLEAKDGAGKIHVIQEPDGLTDSEMEAWHEQNASPEALASAGVSPRALLVIIKSFSRKGDEL
jgi:hypothetical protein